MADAFLKEIVAASSALPGLELRVFVIAWGMTFDGIVSNAGDYDEALRETIATNLKSFAATTGAPSAKAEKALFAAARVHSRDGEEMYLHLRATRTENGGTLPWLRIPFADISGFALQTHHTAQRSKTGF